MTVSELWEEYAKTRNHETRNKIATEYRNFINYMVARIMVPLPSGLEKEDLVQYGFFGLIEAIEKYDPNQGATFETFAGIIIKGRVMDRIRDYGKVSGGPSRTAVKKSKLIEATTRALETKLGRHPTSQEIADEMELSLEQYYKMLNDISVNMQISLDKMVGLDDNLPAIEVVKNEDSVNPEENMLNVEYGELLAKAIDELPEKERMVIIFYYYEGMTLKEIGNFMNRSESRISQIHTQAILRLRSKFKGVD